jgi:23S rRNA (cytosine1962-C5)-methyltransferase
MTGLAVLSDVPPRLPKVTLRKDLRRALHAGAPWLFRDAVDSPRELADGAVVLVAGKDGRPLGRGFFAASGPIAVRMLTTDRGESLPELLDARLEQALLARGALIRSGETTAFRWVHGEGDRLPGLHVDVYDKYASLHFDGPGPRAFYLAHALPERLLERGASLRLQALLERGKRGGGEPSVALAGVLPEGDVDVVEQGLVFRVDLVRGQKGGLFLDQRDNRALVREMSREKRVLNLFGYTGGFSLHAARGGARHTTTVDNAPRAIEAARTNFELNAGLLGTRASDEFLVADVFAFLEEAGARRKRWDLVVSDPPSFAPSERARPQALAAYRRLHALCAAVVEPGGVFCAASCSSHVGESDFVASVENGARDAGRRFELRETHGAASDHPVLAAFPEGRYLKFVVGVVR